MTAIRAYRPQDDPALADICLKTADAGADATGILDDDALWGRVFVLPYVARHPEFAFVVETDDGRVGGYIVCVPDTEAFQEWFAESWWPRFADEYPRPAAEGTRQDWLVTYAYDRDATVDPWVAEYPAHLHIDLLPELQGQGWGRRLIEALVAALREAGVPGLHLVASADNHGAVAFYPRVGFEALPSPDGVRVFGMRL